VLSDRLAGLVEDGVLERRPDPDHAGGSIYELTPAGRDLWPALYALLSWGDRHRYRNSLVFKHSDCGTALDVTAAAPRVGSRPVPRTFSRSPGEAGAGSETTGSPSRYERRTDCSSPSSRHPISGEERPTTDREVLRAETGPDREVPRGRPVALGDGGSQRGSIRTQSRTVGPSP
jgi:DNA-binding MarR family transcriptional regulator